MGLALLAQPVFGGEVLNNGDFEQFHDGVPLGWSTGLAEIAPESSAAS